MTVSVMIDIAIIAVIALFAWLGWKRGLFRTLSELAVVVVALFLASQFSTTAAHYVVDDVLRPATEKAVRAQVLVVASEASRTAQEKAGSVLSAIPNNFVREHAQALLEKTALPDRLGEAGEEALLTACLQMTDNVLNTVVYNLVHSLLYAVCFGILNFVLRLAVRALNRVMRMPVLRQLNQMGGLLVGVGKGVILAYLCVWILSRAGVLEEELTGASVLLGLAEGLPIGLRL